MISYIVDRLNEPPFLMQLTMVAFDEKSPFELLEIVNNIMAQLSPQHRTDLRDETPETTANRMLEFLRVLNYKIVRAKYPLTVNVWPVKNRLHHIHRRTWTHNKQNKLFSTVTHK